MGFGVVCLDSACVYRCTRCSAIVARVIDMEPHNAWHDELDQSAFPEVEPLPDGPSYTPLDRFYENGDWDELAEPLGRPQALKLPPGWGLGFPVSDEEVCFLLGPGGRPVRGADGRTRLFPTRAEAVEHARLWHERMKDER